MKPDWGDAPVWAKYLAMDPDGTWYWFDMLPLKNRHFKNWAAYSGGKKHAAAENSVDWDKTLEARP